MKSQSNPDHLVNYAEQGKRSYLIASSFDDEEFETEAKVLRRLSEEYELCTVGLRKVREEWENMA